GAKGLAKRELLNLPDPFVVITIDSDRTYTTAICRRTLSPTWGDYFDIRVHQSSTISIQIFDHKKFKQRNQGTPVLIMTSGFLGVINISGSEAIEMAVSQAGKTLLSCHLRIVYLSYDSLNFPSLRCHLTKTHYVKQ
ncbi:hypothetical protein BDQ17DRAFT_1237622, partial [Cyathus striatus]